MGRSQPIMQEAKEGTQSRNLDAGSEVETSEEQKKKIAPVLTFCYFFYTIQTTALSVMDLLQQLATRKCSTFLPEGNCLETVCQVKFPFL